jgi:hypothetical protein
MTVIVWSNWVPEDDPSLFLDVIATIVGNETYEGYWFQLLELIN